MEKKTTLIGADPELFLINLDGKFISSIGLIGGSKERPKSIGNGCAVQEDNVAVEFNIAPAENVDAFVSSCQYALSHLTNQVAEKNLFLSITASKSFDADQLKDPKAKHFGCDPDFNAWTKRRNDSPAAKDKNLRSAGGHIHIGTPLNKIQIARWCDVTMGLPSVLEDSDQQRRLLYGKAGSFRGKPYGVEYRTLSNYWLKDTKYMRAVYGRALKAVWAVEQGHMLDDELGSRIQMAINDSNTALADELIGVYNDMHKGLDLSVLR